MATKLLVEKAYAEDFEKIYHALLAPHDPHIAQEDWRQLFIKHWDTPEGYFGYMLVNGEETVGFLGTIFSRRKIHGQEHKFCNITSWVVKPEYRNKSLFLLFPLLKLSDYTLTNLTARDHVAKIHHELGFKEIRNQAQILLPLYRCGYNDEIIFELDKIKLFLKDNDLIIFNDHLKFKCKHILIKSQDNYCYVVASKLVRKMIPFLYVHYISNLNIFISLIDKVIFKILINFTSCVLLVEDHLIRGQSLRGAFKYKLPQYKLFKSSLLQASDLDNLYSERIILNC